MNLWQFGKKGDGNGPAAQQPTQAPAAAKAVVPNIQGFFNKGNAIIKGAIQSGGNGKGNGSLPANAYKEYEQPASEESYAPKAYRVQPGQRDESVNPSDMAENAIPHVPQPKV